MDNTLEAYANYLETIPNRCTTPGCPNIRITWCLEIVMDRNTTQKKCSHCHWYEVYGERLMVQHSEFPCRTESTTTL